VLNELYATFEEMPHNLEGWREAGNVVAELCLAGQWLCTSGLMSLPGPERESAQALMQGGKLATRERRLTRREVWQRGAGELVKISGGVVCDLLGDDYASEQRVKKHAFEFRDAEIAPGVLLRFESRCNGADGVTRYLPEGEKFLVSVNPFNASRLFVRDAAGRFVGECARIEAVSRFDTEALTAAVHRASRDEAAQLQPLRARQQKETRKRLQMHKHNAATIKEHASGATLQKANALDSLARHFAASEADE
jgi:hypothetical protein